MKLNRRRLFTALLGAPLAAKAAPLAPAPIVASRIGTISASALTGTIKADHIASVNCRPFTAEEIAKIFRVPVHMVRATQKSSIT